MALGNMSQKPIGVFDSGIGGLTVLKELLARLPNENFVYFGDTARVPYGNKSSDTVRRFSSENVKLLLERGVKMVVVACNTATADALPQLQSEFKLPIIGVIQPGVRAALAASHNGRIGVIGTSGTIRSMAYQNGILAVKPDARVVSKACPLFVPLVEEGWTDTQVTRLVVEEYLKPLAGLDIDTLVLGCTHYPLLSGGLSLIMGDRVTLVSSAEETAKDVFRVLVERDLLRPDDAPPPEHELRVTGDSEPFQRLARRFLGDFSAASQVGAAR